MRLYINFQEIPPFQVCLIRTPKFEVYFIFMLILYFMLLHQSVMLF